MPARKLWLSHLSAMLMAGAAMMAVCAGVVALHQRLLSPLIAQHGLPPEPSLVSMLPYWLGGLFLAGMLVQSIRPGLSRLTPDRANMLRIATVLLGVTLLILWLYTLAPLFVLVPLLIAGVLTWRTVQSLPAALLLAPGASTAVGGGAAGHVGQPTGARGSGLPRSDDRAAVADPAGSKRRSRSAGAIVGRCIYGGPQAWFFCLFFLFFGALLAGLLQDFDGGPDTSLSNIIISWYMLLAFVPLLMKKLHLLDALPISRKRLFGLITLPALLFLCLGYGLIKLRTASLVEPQSHILLQDCETYHCVLISPEYFEIAWNGQAPEAGSPWGESHPPRVEPLLPGMSLAIYKPYTTPAGSSPEFMALQISRAMEKVYGVSIPAAEIQQRYLAVAENGQVAPKTEGLPYRQDYPDLKSTGQGRVFPLVLVLVAVPYLLLVAVVMRTYRAGVSDVRRKIIAVAIMMTILGLHLVTLGLLIKTIMQPWVFTAFWKILARNIAEAVPGGVPGMWILALLVCLGAYRFSQSEFLKIEVPLQTKKEADT